MYNSGVDWRDFRFEWRVREGDLFPLLLRIEAHRESASHLLLPSRWADQLDRLNRVRAVHGTTALEGNPLTEAEVRQQMELAESASEDEPPEGSATKRPVEHREIRNASRAQDWVKGRFAAEDPGPVSLGDLLQMHSLLTTGSDEGRTAPGALRTVSVVVGSEELGGVHRGAPPDEVPRLMDEFVEFLGSRRLAAVHPAIQALLAHFFLVTIHPFGDGNGRVSRLTEAAILFRGRYNLHGFYGLSNYFYRNRDDYIRLLQGSRRSQPFDLQEFVEFGLTGFADELKGINDFIKTKLNRVLYRGALDRARTTREGTRRRMLNEREHSLLTFLLDRTEPTDPFAEDSSRRFPLDDLIAEPLVSALYRKGGVRALLRELSRLAERGFIPIEPRHDGFVELDFQVISRY